MTIEEFVDARYGMFLHYGLFSSMARGEWVMNREQISPGEMEKMARKFNPDKFDADEICQLAFDGGMKYIVFTTMHHEGFRLYDSDNYPYCSKSVCGRDLVAEIIDAARRRNLKIGLYHSLNNWYEPPDAVSAYEALSRRPGHSPKANVQDDYSAFIGNTFARIKELVSKYAPIDILWYDGWWPFNAEEWQAEEMNHMVRSLQPHILFNGRNGLPGDFGTPEQHIGGQNEWRPWEACFTLNSHWGYHEGDNEWKSPRELVKMLLTCANGRGNLLLNIGPRGDGSIPETSAHIVRQVGKWLQDGGREAVSNNLPMKFGPLFRDENEFSDWDPNGMFSASGNNLFFTLLYASPDSKLRLAGLENKILSVNSAKYGNLQFTQNGGKMQIELPEKLNGDFCPVIKMECEGRPAIYRTGGMRIPQCKHPRYDPVTPDLEY